MSHVLALLSHTIGTVDIRVTFVTGLSSRRTIFFRKSYKINKFRGKHLHLITSIFNFVCLLILSSPPPELPCILLLREFVMCDPHMYLRKVCFACLIWNMLDMNRFFLLQKKKFNLEKKMILVLKIAQYHSSAGNTREISNLKLGVSKN